MCVCVILVQHPLATKKPGFAPELESAAAAGHAGAWEGDGAPVQGEAAFRGTRDLAQSRLLPFLARRRNHGKEKNLKNPSRTAARRNLMAKTLSLPSLVFLFVSLSLSLSLCSYEATLGGGISAIYSARIHSGWTCVTRGGDPKNDPITKEISAESADPWQQVNIPDVPKGSCRGDLCDR